MSRSSWRWWAFARRRSPLRGGGGRPGADSARPVLHVAYFVPNDREPEPDSIVRLDRVLADVQRFYREGMRQYGLRTGSSGARSIARWTAFFALSLSPTAR